MPVATWYVSLHRGEKDLNGYSNWGDAFVKKKTVVN